MPTTIAYPDDESVLGYLVEQTSQHFDRMRASGAATAAPPSRPQFDGLLRACFAASAEQEEGRRVEFTVFFDAKAELSDYNFLDRPELSAGVLARLSAALDPLRSYLCVTGEADGLKIVGIRHWGDHRSFVRAGGNPSHVVIRVAAPGVFVVRYDTKILLTYWRGSVARYEMSDKPHRAAVDALLRSIPNADAGLYAKAQDALVYLAEWMLRLKHGGTLLVVPPGSKWKSLVSTARFATADPVQRVANALSASVHGRPTGPVELDDRARRLKMAEFPHENPDLQLAVELEWLAQLTATDGMTVVDTNLNLCGFGLFFSMSSEKVSVEIVDPYAPGTRDAREVASLGGARHQSAAVTCHALPDATAIVASQDGTLTAMRRDGEGPVVVRKHLELLLRT